jgi:uncharacterized protein (DUF58 family)
MRTLQTCDISKYLLAALATGIILLAAPVGASAEYTVVKRPRPPVVNDHRLDPTVTVRDHRAVPKVTVRDHRAVPTVNDHRAQTTSATTGSAGGVTYTPRKKKVAPPPPVYTGMQGGGR